MANTFNIHSKTDDTNVELDEEEDDQWYCRNDEMYELCDYIFYMIYSL
jgi:hypothetical protein